MGKNTFQSDHKNDAKKRMKTNYEKKMMQKNDEILNWKKFANWHKNSIETNLGKSCKIRTCSGFKEIPFKLLGKF